MDPSQRVLNDLAARIGQLTVQLALATAERDALRDELAKRQDPDPEDDR